MSEFPPIVLVVGFQDNEPCVDVLEQAGFWVAQSDSLDAALADITELQPDAVVTDMTGAGPEPETALIVRALKTTPAASAVPLIVVEPPQARRMPLPELGSIDARLFKPVAPLELRQTIERLLATSRVAPRPVIQNARAVVQAAAPVDVEPPAGEPEAESPARQCPGCGRTLEWTERNTLDGLEYDYFRWCDGGCGLYSFEVASRRLLKLA